MAELPTWARLVELNEELRPWTSDGWCLDHTGTEWEWWHDKTNAVLEQPEHEDVAHAFIERRALEWLAMQQVHIVLQGGEWFTAEIDPETTTWALTDIARHPVLSTAIRMACAAMMHDELLLDRDEDGDRLEDGQVAG